MPWIPFGWEGMSNSSGGGSGSGSTLKVHGSSFHDNTVPSMKTLDKYAKLTDLDKYAKISDIPNLNEVIPPEGLFENVDPKPLSEILAAITERLLSMDINPNLLYNSTGMVSMSGWISTTNTTYFRDQFVLDDNTYFIITGDNSDTGFISKSIPVEPNKTYTMSGTFNTHGNEFAVIIGYQTKEQLNTTNTFKTEAIVIDWLSDDWEYVTRTFTCPENTAGCYINFIQMTDDNTATSFIRQVKIEEGTTASKWVPSMTDPYQNIIAATSFNAASLKNL